MDIDNAISHIASDNTSGAAELAQQGVEVLAAACEEPSASVESLAEVGLGLIRAKPAMASFVNMTNYALWAAGRDDLSAAKAALERLGERLEAAPAAIARHALVLLPEQGVVLTISRSSTVLACFEAALREGRHLRVICPESRPMCEGVALARALAGMGAEVMLISDGMATPQAERADLVLVGGDALTEQGLVNKAGTYGLALAAREAGVPLYAACGREKLLPPDCAHLFGEDPHDAAELLPEPIEGVEALNLYFDLTPLDLLTGVITEEGVLTPRRGLERLRELSAHPMLCARE
ncbi:MAG: translation initiation factor eIF-2B [Armatimonadota bacterium]